MKRTLATLAAALTVGVIAGCGGSGTPSPAAATIAGAVADGYLVGATVFLDKNGNYQLDPGEPSATTDANGAYTLTVDPADVGHYPVVALALQGVTVDKDTGLPLTSSYVLSLPKQSVSGTVNSNFISPMSSTVREMMETGNYTMQQAMDQLRSELGLSIGTDIMANYMSNPSNSSYQVMHNAAQNMASVMGSQMGQVMSGTGAGSSVDLNRYRGMMGTIFSNMSSLKGSGSGMQGTMTSVMNTVTSTVSNIGTGMPYQNMSSSFRGGMTGSRNGGGMMGR